MNLGMFLHPTLIFFVRIGIVEDDVQLSIPEGGNDAIHEAEEVRSPPALRMGG